MMDSSTIREISLSPSDDDAALLLQKFHQHGKIQNCATCGKDTSLQIAMVPCNYCTLPLYCSVYCRGNDRYKHAATCAGSQQSTVPWKAAAENKESHQDPSLAENASPEKRGKMIQPPPAQEAAEAEAVVQETTPTPTTPSLVGLNTEAESTPSKQRSMATTQRAPMVSLFAASPAAAPSPASTKTTTTPSPSKTRRTSRASPSPPLSGAKQYQEVRSQLESIDAPSSSSPALPRAQEQVAKS